MSVIIWEDNATLLKTKHNGNTVTYVQFTEIRQRPKMHVFQINRVEAQIPVKQNTECF